MRLVYLEMRAVLCFSSSPKILFLHLDTLNVYGFLSMVYITYKIGSKLQTNRISIIKYIFTSLLQAYVFKCN